MNPIHRAVTELKVIASTTASAVVGVVIAVLNAYVANPGMLGETPAVLEFILVALIPPAVTFLSGYVAPHTPRPSYGDDVPRTRHPLSPR